VSTAAAVVRCCCACCCCWRLAVVVDLVISCVGWGQGWLEVAGWVVVVVAGGGGRQGMAGWAVVVVASAAVVAIAAVGGLLLLRQGVQAGGPHSTGGGSGTSGALRLTARAFSRCSVIDTLWRICTATVDSSSPEAKAVVLASSVHTLRAS